MTALIEIVCSASKEEAAQATVEAFCKEASGRLIGRRVNVEAHEIMLMVELQHTVSVSKHVTTFSHALQQEVIASFRYVTHDMVKISFDPTVDLLEQMLDFPLRPDESWFPAIDDAQQAYVCLRRPLMSANQAAWLLKHEVSWVYV